MKLLRMIMVVGIVLMINSTVFAETQSSPKWGNLIDVAYKFSWYPKKDFYDLLEKKSAEYESSLEEYTGILRKELTDGRSESGLISPDSFVKGKDWKNYYRLAVAQFCLFLATDKSEYLKNAQITLNVLVGKMDLSGIAFWHYLFQAYDALDKKDRDAFVQNVFLLWQNVILKLETDDILTLGALDDKPEFVRNLNFLYENMAHLIITRAIIENTLPELSPLGVIICSLGNKLTSDIGYKNIIDSLVERMHGLKSDNSNLNFATAFVEATANQYEFEEEKDNSRIISGYNSTRTYYDLALSWANTQKGRVAILTQYLGFNSYILRRLIDKDPLLVGNEVFNRLPEKCNKTVKDAINLYDQLSQSAVRNSGFEKCGFKKEDHYISAMHQLWDASAKLLLIQAAYYKSTAEPGRMEDLYMAESPLIQYLSFFKNYAQDDLNIIPENAYYLASYSARELGDIYRTSSNYSTRIEINNLAFEYQLQAIKLFPMDITGILQLALQANQEGRLNRYIQEVGPIASKFERSKVASIWVDSNPSKHDNCMSLVKNVIPSLINRAYFLVRFLQKSNVKDSEDELYLKVVTMGKLMMAMESRYSDEEIEQVLTAISSQSFRNRTASEVLQTSLPTDMKALANDIPGLEQACSFSNLKNELYGSLSSSSHLFLRELYYETGGL